MSDFYREKRHGLGFTAEHLPAFVQPSESIPQYGNLIWHTNGHHYTERDKREKESRAETICKISATSPRAEDFCFETSLSGFDERVMRGKRIVGRREETGGAKKAPSGSSWFIAHRRERLALAPPWRSILLRPSQTLSSLLLLPPLLEQICTILSSSSYGSGTGPSWSGLCQVSSLHADSCTHSCLASKRNIDLTGMACAECWIKSRERPGPP